MRSYFHNFPTCPSCHTPHEFSSVKKVNPEDLCENCGEIKGFCHTNNCDVYLMKNDENYDLHPVYKCMNCEAYFKSNIDFSKYPKALSVFQEHTNSTSDSIPLYWNIKLNEIEQSYLEWLDFNEDSIYWITWPWDDVKFMPILIAEYALKFPSKKIVVVSNFHEGDVENEFYKPNLYETLDYLYTFEPPENLFNEFKKEMGKFNPIKDIIKKSKKVHFHLTPLKSNLTPHDITKDYSVYNFKLTHAMVCNIINEQFGNKFVKSVNLNDSKKNCRNVNKKYYDVSVDDNMDWGVRRVLFDKLGYFNILYNFDSVHKLSDDLNYTEVFDDDFDLNKHVFFIDSNNEKLFDHLHKINPDTVIFTDADKFFTDYRSNYWIKRQRGEKFINLLKNNEFSTILFSTERSVRFIFNQLDENNLFDSTTLYKHTWDSSEVLECIENNQSYNYIFSSSLNDFESMEEPNVEYCNVPSMELIEKHIDEIFAKIKTNQNLYFPFFRTLKTTPLPLLEDGEFPTFIYNGLYSLKGIMNNLCEIINGDMDEDEYYDELMEPFNKIYQSDSIKLYNPLRAKIEEIINQYETENYKIKVISYNLQKKQLKNVLNIDQYDGKVDVVTWIDLANLEESEEKILVISTLYPLMDFDIYDDKIDKYIFIGGPNYIEFMKNIMDKRILEKEARPLEMIDNNAPSLLIDTLADIPDNSSEIKEIIQEITIDLNSTINVVKRSDNQEKCIEISKNVLKKDTSAILFVDENQNAMFFPANHVINYKFGNEFAEYDLSKGQFKNLIGKQLFVSNEYYRSNKEVFVRFMVEHGDNLIFRLNDNIQFKGFKSFLEANYEWLNNFKELLSLLDKRIRIRDSKLLLANKIRQASGANFEYIENVWLSDPMIISTSKGEVKIYPIDRPRNADTLIKVYEELSNYFSIGENSHEEEILNQLNLSESDAMLNYQCSINYQKYRQDFLDGKIKGDLYENFSNELNDILDSSNLFTISSAPKKVQLKEEVYPFKIICDFDKYI